MKRRRHPIDTATVTAAAVVEAAAASILCAVGPHAYAQTPTVPPVVAAAPLNPNSDCTLDPSQPTRRRPGHTPRDHDEAECDPNRLPTPDTTALPAPAAQDRWRIVDQIGAPATVVNPYATNNLLKGDRPLLDRPIFGGNWFFNGTATSNTLLESRRIPVSAVQGTPFLGPKQQQFDSQTMSLDTVLYRGDTIFQPPDLQFRFTPIFNYSSTHTNGAQVSTSTFGAQALFVEKHLRDVSANYDFDSVRVGIQAVNSDFRGFILADQPVGIRVFGTRDNDVYQYNIGVFRPLPKNAARQDEFGAGIPDNDIVLANLYVQDLFRPGLTSEFLFLYDRNRAPGTEIVAAAPGAAPATFINGSRHNYDVAYLGYSVDGHVGKLNLTGSVYEVLGLEEASEFGANHTRVQASFAAAELSRDFDWIRVRASGLYASGDSAPFDKTAHGFDGLSQSALFAGADSSFFIHQQLPLALSQINLKARDSLFPDLRSSAAPGASNYENPGLRLVGLGADFDFSPAVRLSFDANHLWFDQTATLAAVLGRSLPGRDIGTDLSFDLFYRPLDSQNVILRLTAARLLTAPATQQLTGGNAPFSAFFNLILTY
ncbi:MAG: hypothetical protein JWL65_3373 [Gammaproteobacteria bacterium]|nr:hypothetical protein [Gammaproteobacteria bacterium]